MPHTPYEMLEHLKNEIISLDKYDENKIKNIRLKILNIINNLDDKENLLIELNSISYQPPLWDNQDVKNKQKYFNEAAIKLLELLNLIEQRHFLYTVNTKIINKKNKKIFIVHGHDKEMIQSVARTLEKLSLTPIILYEQPDEGKTIIEKFIANSDTSYAIILLSPDDISYKKGDDIEKATFRARQNVIFELGYFIGKIGRKNVFPLFKKTNKFELPSDYLGTLYKEYDDKGKWRFELVKELKNCGFNVDANKILTM